MCNLILLHTHCPLQEPLLDIVVSMWGDRSHTAAILGIWVKTDLLHFQYTSTFEDSHSEEAGVVCQPSKMLGMEIAVPKCLLLWLHIYNYKGCISDAQCIKMHMVT